MRTGLPVDPAARSSWVLRSQLSTCRRQGVWCTAQPPSGRKASQSNGVQPSAKSGKQAKAKSPRPKPPEPLDTEQSIPTISANGAMVSAAAVFPELGSADVAVQARQQATTQRPANQASLQVVNPAQEEPETFPLVYVSKPLPRVLILHTGGTMGMDPQRSFEDRHGHIEIKSGTGGHYPRSRPQGLKPGDHLSRLLHQIPEMRTFANLDLKVPYNKDSSRVGPKEWEQLARTLHENRQQYDAFIVVHGTDTMAYTACALSMMLVGFGKPIVLTGSQLPLLNPRTDARTNMIDAVSCATAYFAPPHVHLQEVAICFGGFLLRGNRAQKVDSSVYNAFATPSYPPLARMGVDIEWNRRYMLQVEGGVYRPRFKLDPRVIRVPIVPGSDPRLSYGDLMERGVRGIVLEAFGVGNMPDLQSHGWLPWLKQQRRKGLVVCLASQCTTGPLHPELYRAGSVAVSIGVEAGPKMTPECASVKLMQCLAYPDMGGGYLGVPLAGEL